MPGERRRHVIRRSLSTEPGKTSPLFEQASRDLAEEPTPRGRRLVLDLWSLISPAAGRGDSLLLLKNRVTPFLGRGSEAPPPEIPSTTTSNTDIIFCGDIRNASPRKSPTTTTC